MARVRSPNFPVISLPAAIERIEKIYTKEQTIPATRETIAEHLGYSGMNGASLKVVSALLKYGLLEETKDKLLRVSPLAMAIMHPASEQEKADALQQAADGPVLFQRLNTQFEGRRPSDTNLRSWLLRNGFATSAVDSVITAYSETMDLVGGIEALYKTSEAPKPIEVHSAVHGHTASNPSMGLRQVATAPLTAVETDDPFSVEMLKGRVRVVGDLSNREDAQTLLDFLKSAIAFLPAKATVLPPAQNEDEDDA